MKRRRTVLAALGSASVATLAGCGGFLTEEDAEDREDDEDDEDDEPAAVFADEFDDGDFEDTWEFRSGNEPDDDLVEERDGVLYHQSPKEYNNGADLSTQQSFESSGTVELRTMIRSLREDYWGFGVALRFENGGGIELKEQRWGRDDELQLKFLRPDAENDVTRVADLGYPSDATQYGFTVDFENGVVRGVHRGNDALESALEFPTSDFGTDSYWIRIGVGRGHEVEYDVVTLSSA